MILPDYELWHWIGEKCGVTPAILEHVNPASLDLCIGSEWIDQTTGEKHDTDTITIYPPNNIREVWYKICKFIGLKPEHKPTAILATTVELVYMLPDFDGFGNGLAGDVKLKSSMARMGLDHALAGWIDPGFRGEITLELHSHRKVELRAGQRICQLIVHKMPKPRNVYDGKYQNQVGPTRSRIDEN